jgi:protein-S-isoprenylcysteine O-methyltransferase Ste14
MVEAPINPKPMSTASLFVRMVIYTIVFLSIVLLGVPWLFHRAGLWIIGSLLNGDPLALAGVIPGQQILGGAIFLLGLAGYLFCSIWLTAVGRGPFVEFDPPRQFVASGPYRFCRNPIAALLVFTVLGEAVYLGSMGIFAFVLIGLPIAHYQVTRLEEPLLLKRFGDDYDAYCRAVPRWLPRLTPYSPATAPTR